MMVIYRRFAVVELDGAMAPNSLPACSAAHRVGELNSTQALYELWFDHAQWQVYEDATDYFCFPSLNAPADRLVSSQATYLADQGVTPGTGDTVLNVLRSLRDSVDTLDSSYKIDDTM
jgi:hypothetical protein